MSTSIEIDGVNLIPVKEATSLVSYSKDYISRLAREGKIVASQVGRQWFVDAVSLKNFADSASLQEEARKGELRAERKRELQAQEKFHNLENFSSSISRRHRVEALGVSVATLCLGLVVGVSVYTSSLFALPTSSAPDSVAFVSSPLKLEKLADPAVNDSVPVVVSEPSDIAIFSSVEKYPVFETVSETRILEGDVPGILLFAQAGELHDPASVEALFSDAVKVNFTSDNTGTVSFEKEKGNTTEVPFVTVPSQVEHDGLSEVSTAAL
ncbi:MAG: helix-turn-helix domain-containing protein [Candidatus Paceibacterota bacterium]